MSWLRVSLVGMLVAGLLSACGGGRDLSPEAQQVQALLSPPDLLGQTASAVSTEPTSGRDGAMELTPSNGQLGLDLGVPPDAGWAIVGRAMIRSGFAIVESDADAGTHVIRYSTAVDDASRPEDEGRGALSRLAFWRSDDAAETMVEQFVLRVSERSIGERGVGSRVTLETQAGTPPPAPVTRQVLGVLAEQLRP